MVAIACTGYELGSAREEVPGICYPRSKNFRQSRKGSEFSQHGNSEFSQHGNFAPNVFFPRRVRGRPICLPAMAPSVAARAGFWIEFFPFGPPVGELARLSRTGNSWDLCDSCRQTQVFPSRVFPSASEPGGDRIYQNGAERSSLERAKRNGKELPRAGRLPS